MNDTHSILKEDATVGILNDLFNVKDFKKKFKIVIIRHNWNEMEFDMIGAHYSLVNQFRRIILSDVPTMAIEKVYVSNNTSFIADEIFAHRLGLIPLKVDPRQFEFHNEASEEYTETDSLEFELKVKCSKRDDVDSALRDELYDNYKVFSNQIKWIPKGNQKERFNPHEVGPMDDILIVKMMPKQEIDMKLIAVKGYGRDHTKFSPVATVYYRLLPHIQLTREVEGEAAVRLQSCFSPGVIELEQKNGKKIAKVKSARYDMNSRNIYRYPDIKDAVICSKVSDHFIFTIESVGALSPDAIFQEAVKSLKTTCLNLLEELKC